MKAMFVLFVVASFYSAASLATTKCYNLPANTNSPHATPLFDFFPQAQTTESWCYKEFKKSGENFVFLYEASNKNIPLDQAILLRKSDNAIVLATSLSKNSIFHVTSDLSLIPSNVPFDLNLKILKSTGTLIPQTMNNNSHEMLKEFLKNLNEKSRSMIMLSENLTNNESVYLDYIPFKGYWWPQNAVDIATGGNSPLEKYDKLILSRTGQSPESAVWEREHHDYTEPWAGHCNGWASSAILYEEPTKSYYDKASRIIFTTTDIKAILNEASFCVSYRFYGKRHRGRDNDNDSDIVPHRFHKVLQYYLKHLNLPIVMDLIYDAPVRNRIITGYSSIFTPIEGRRGWFHVKTSLRIHKAALYVYVSGPSKDIIQNYTYTLKINESGNIVDGEWLSREHPDFMWFPVVQKNCGRENPRINIKQFLNIIKNN